MQINLDRLKNAVKDIKENSYEGNDSHSRAEYNGLCDGLNRLVEHFREIEENEK